MPYDRDPLVDHGVLLLLAEVKHLSPEAGMKLLREACDIESQVWSVADDAGKLTLEGQAPRKLVEWVYGELGVSPAVRALLEEAAAIEPDIRARVSILEVAVAESLKRWENTRKPL